MREVLEALEWVRREMMHRGSPDFIRQRQLEGRVHQLALRMVRSNQVANGAGRTAQGRRKTEISERLEIENRPTLSPFRRRSGQAISGRKGCGNLPAKSQTTR